jgi:hypothetical protein
MAQNFFVRLREYYLGVAKVLRGEADAASVFANTSDIGMSRENAYKEFLVQHAPSKCNVFLGGFLFDDDGNESKQLDIIITTDTTPRYDLHNANGSGKSFSPVEGTLGIVSVKSTLNRNELFDALSGIASVPLTRPLGERLNKQVKFDDYQDWPLKVIYASKGIDPQTLLSHLNEYYLTNAHVPLHRRPDIIHVAGSCFICRAHVNTTVYYKGTGETVIVPPGTFELFTDDSDLQAILWTLAHLQRYASVSTHILFDYTKLIDKINELP